MSVLLGYHTQQSNCYDMCVENLKKKIKTIPKKLGENLYCIITLYTLFGLNGRGESIVIGSVCLSVHLYA